MDYWEGINNRSGRGIYASSPASLASGPAPVPIPDMTLAKLAELHPEWSVAASNASGSAAQIYTLANNHVGCGLLIGIDRLLVPFHLVENADASHFRIYFNIEDEALSLCYIQEFRGLEFLDKNPCLDYAIIRLCRADGGPGAGHYPGEFIDIPDIAKKNQFDPQYEQALLAHSSNGSTVVCVADSCPLFRQRDNGYCSYAQTSPGSSGGSYFTKQGSALAMHCGRIDPHCGGGNERIAVYLEDIFDVSYYANFPKYAPSDAPICPLKNIGVISACAIPIINSCIIFEKKPVDGWCSYGEYWCHYREGFPKNPYGAGQRYVSLDIHAAALVAGQPKPGALLTGRYFKIAPNPHGNVYNNDPEQLYKEAGKRVLREYYNHKKSIPGSFDYSAYGQGFTAEPST